MSPYVLSAFIESFHEWVAEHDPSPDWQLAVLGWIIDLERYVFDDSILDTWRGHRAWTARIWLKDDSKRVVTCTYDVHNEAQTALCRRLRFAPFYDDPNQDSDDD